MSQRVLSSYQFKAPPGYYRQPPREAALSSAKPASQHLRELGNELDGEAFHTKENGVHHLEVHHHGDGTSEMVWQGRTKSWEHKPGEIHMIRSKQPGAAAEMHDTARALAQEHPKDFAMPKHSWNRTLRGAQWVHQEQLRHGEQPWGIPDEGTPAAEAKAYQQSQPRRRAA